MALWALGLIIALSLSRAYNMGHYDPLYLLGVGLISESIGFNLPNEQHIQSLLQITDKAMSQLQALGENRKAAGEEKSGGVPR